MKKIFIMVFLVSLFQSSFSIDLSWCYKKTFKVSAYYSPVAGQKFYYKWNYYKEIRLNGRWIQGASGKRVFNGMLAAGKKYKFWTKIYFPSLHGVWQVEDRWNWNSHMTALQMEELRKKKENTIISNKSIRWRGLFMIIDKLVDKLYFKDSKNWWLIVWIEKELKLWSKN
jgi:hypothetical protein